MRFEFCCAALAGHYHLNSCTRSRCQGCRPVRERIARLVARFNIWHGRRSGVPADWRKPSLP